MGTCYSARVQAGAKIFSFPPTVFTHPAPGPQGMENQRCRGQLVLLGHEERSARRLPHVRPSARPSFPPVPLGGGLQLRDPETSYARGS